MNALSTAREGDRKLVGCAGLRRFVGYCSRRIPNPACYWTARLPYGPDQHYPSGCKHEGNRDSGKQPRSWYSSFHDPQEGRSRTSCKDLLVVSRAELASLSSHGGSVMGGARRSDAPLLPDTDYGDKIQSQA